MSVALATLAPNDSRLALALAVLHTLRLQTLQEGRGLSHGDLRDLAHADLSHPSYQTQEAVATFDLPVCRGHGLERRVDQRQTGGSEHGTGLQHRKRIRRLASPSFPAGLMSCAEQRSPDERTCLLGRICVQTRGQMSAMATAA